MDPISVAGFGVGAASLAFQLFAGCVKGFVLLSTAHNLGKDSSTMLCMLNLQEIQPIEWAKRAGLLQDKGTLDRRLNETIICSVLKELQDLLLCTEKLKKHYKVDLVAISLSSQEQGPSGTSPVVHGILGDAISDELRGDITYRAWLIQSKNSFPLCLRWASVDKRQIL